MHDMSMVVPPAWLLTLTVAVNALGVIWLIAVADSACCGVGMRVPGLGRSAMNTLDRYDDGSCRGRERPGHQP